MANTGFKAFLLRAQYIDGVFQGEYEDNTEFLPGGGADPNYVPPVQDLATCPTSVTVWSCQLAATNSGSPICTVGSNFNAWKDTSGDPISGTQFYTDSSGTDKATFGSGTWYKYNNTNSKMLRIASGLVSATGSCF